MKCAIAAIHNGAYGYHRASKIYNVPKATLFRRVKGTNKVASGVQKVLGSGRTVLTRDMEKKLASHILKMEEMLFGLGIRDVCRLAYELAERNGLAHKFNRRTKMAGYHWFYSFIGRFPHLSVRKPESVSAQRSRSFSKKNVDEFFHTYKTLLDKHSFPPHLIFNMDEKGVSTVPNCPPKIIGMRGKKQVGTMTSAERGVNTTVVVCGNGSGEFIPPYFIFPRKKKNPEFMKNAPQGSDYHAETSGWMTYEGFNQWLKFFIARVGCTVERKCLVILDGHITHVNSIAAIELARDNGVELLKFPPHCTHRMQPMDVTVMGPLQTGFSKHCALWMRQNPGSQISIYQIAELFGKAFEGTRMTGNLASGFKKCGIWPVKEDIFEGQYVTAHQNPSTSTLPLGPGHQSASDLSSDEGHPDTNSIDPADIVPLPTITYSGKGKQRRRTNSSAGSVVITSSPHLKKLRLEDENRTLKEEVKRLKRELKGSKKTIPDTDTRSGKSYKCKARVRKQPPAVNSNTDDDLPPVSPVRPGTSKGKARARKQPPAMNNLPAAQDRVYPQSLRPGQFVLVKFDVKDGACHYAGFTLEMVTSKGIEIKFLRRVRRAINPSRTKLRFEYPCEEDIKRVPAKDIVMVLQVPEVRPTSSKRISSQLIFDDHRFEHFFPIY
eukprot:sb/3462789/